jgi:NlpC/P60 family putative phage cell wall peptidase
MTSIQDRVLAEARDWLGTPYRHQASLKGAGCDCLGLVRGIWRALIGPEPEAAPDYRPDWAEASGRETLLEAAQRHLIPVELEEAQAGDVLLFRMGEGAMVKHCAIISAVPTPSAPTGRIIHAYWGRACVESWMGPWWLRRCTHAFAFPEPRAFPEQNKDPA